MGDRTRPGNADQRISGRALMALRRKHWLLVGGLCAMCGRLTELHAQDGGFDLDHIMPIEDGGQDTDENRQVLCVFYGPEGKSGCHHTKTVAEAAQRARQGQAADIAPGRPILAALRSYRPKPSHNRRQR